MDKEAIDDDEFAMEMCTCINCYLRNSPPITGTPKQQSTP